MSRPPRHGQKAGADATGGLRELVEGWNRRRLDEWRRLAEWAYDEFSTSSLLVRGRLKPATIAAAVEVLELFHGFMHEFDGDYRGGYDDPSGPYAYSGSVFQCDTPASEAARALVTSFGDRLGTVDRDRIFATCGHPWAAACVLPVISKKLFVISSGVEHEQTGCPEVLCPGAAMAVEVQHSLLWHRLINTYSRLRDAYELTVWSPFIRQAIDDKLGVIPVSHLVCMYVTDVQWNVHNRWNALRLLGPPEKAYNGTTHSKLEAISLFIGQGEDYVLHDGFLELAQSITERLCFMERRIAPLLAEWAELAPKRFFCDDEYTALCKWLRSVECDVKSPSSGPRCTAVCPSGENKSVGWDNVRQSDLQLRISNVTWPSILAILVPPRLYPFASRQPRFSDALLAWFKDCTRDCTNCTIAPRQFGVDGDE